MITSKSNYFLKELFPFNGDFGNNEKRLQKKSPFLSDCHPITTCLFQTSNNRKALLDEMAVTLQTKTDVANESIAKLEEDLESVKLKLQVKKKTSICLW